mmetsp:Transcript_19581/g.49795  ORF Transcript_19581/g.49795 Transcript_19581/m.49795 type:complete len:241 (+) Transcript_19581:46-768(+)
MLPKVMVKPEAHRTTLPTAHTSTSQHAHTTRTTRGLARCHQDPPQPPATQPSRQNVLQARCRRGLPQFWEIDEEKSDQSAQVTTTPGSWMRKGFACQSNLLSAAACASSSMHMHAHQEHIPAPPDTPGLSSQDPRPQHSTQAPTDAHTHAETTHAHPPNSYAMCTEVPWPTPHHAPCPTNIACCVSVMLPSPCTNAMLSACNAPLPATHPHRIMNRRSLLSQLSRKRSTNVWKDMQSLEQ